MKPSINPVHRYGKKNIFCPHYETCLDHAVEQCWRSWKCDHCAYESIREPLKNVQFLTHDDSPYYSLGRR